MKTPVRSPDRILQEVAELMHWSSVLADAPNPGITPTQRLDIRTVSEACIDFQRHVEGAHETICYEQDENVLSILRHGLRNILNLVIGFTHMLLRLESLATLTLQQAEATRHLAQLGDKLIESVENLR